MAPLSYYWLISFIYLVIVKIEIVAFFDNNLAKRIVTRQETSHLVGYFYLKFLTLNAHFAVPH